MSTLINCPQQHNTLNVYRTLPPHCIAFEVVDRHSLPFIEPGEVVVVDTEDRTPRVGNIYVIEWIGGRRNVCQASQASGRWKIEPKDPYWEVSSLRSLTPAEYVEWLVRLSLARRDGMLLELPGGWKEGPFTFEHLESKFVGAVIGLYKPKGSAA